MGGGEGGQSCWWDEPLPLPHRGLLAARDGAALRTATLHPPRWSSSGGSLPGAAQGGPSTLVDAGLPVGGWLSLARPLLRDNHHTFASAPGPTPTGLRESARGSFVAE